MSYRRLSGWVVLVFALGSVSVLRAQGGSVSTALGNSPTGTVVEWSLSYNHLYYEVGGGGYGQNPLSGLTCEIVKPGPVIVALASSYTGDNTRIQTSFTQSGSFTVPVGETWIFRTYARVEGQSWSYTDTPYTGVAGNYQPALGDKAAKLIFNNPSSVPMTYKVLNGTVEIDNITIPAGGTVVQSYGGLASGAELSVVSRLDGYEFSDGVWVEANGVSIEYTNIPGSGAGSLTAATTATLGGGGSSTFPGYTVTNDPAQAAANTVPVMPNYPAGPLPPAPAAGSTVWSNQTGSQTDLVTNSVFRQGVDKLVAQDKASQKAVVDQLKANDANAKARDDAAKTVRDKQGALADAVTAAKASGDTATANMGGQGVAAKSQAEALFGSTPTSRGWELTASGAPDLSVSMPSRFGGGTFQFNPFTPERLGPVASWFRAAMAWLTIATLGVWVWRQLGEWVRGFSSVQQARGNPVVGGTGAQATALAAAGLMTTAIVVGITALLSWSFGEIGLSSFVASVTTNPLATIPTGALWMLDQLFPVATMVTALVARVTFNLYASTVYAGCAAVVRFIVP